MTVIIDYGMGNLFSVENALKHLGAEVKISNTEEDIQTADKIILPGVGAFPDGMKNLKNLGIIEILEEAVFENKKPILGICLGMQLLATEGEEDSPTMGLGWIAGRVRRFDIDENHFRLPHVGWNDIVPRKDTFLFRGVERPTFYFVHSYHLVPEDNSVVAATCAYGEDFVTAVQKDNIIGVQFHPEKSQRSGLRVLKNFIDYT